MRMFIKSLGVWNFDRILVPEAFRENPPKPEKIIDKMLRFSRESELEDIIVDENYHLMDGYCSYLIARQVGIEFAKIKMVVTAGGRKK